VPSPRRLLLALSSLCLTLSCGAPLDARPAPRPAGGVQLLVGPEAGGQAVLSLFAGARRSLWLEIYLLTDDQVIETLVARRKAGVDVRVVLEPHPYQADGANDDAFARLAAAGALVAWASPRFALTHAKVAIVDHARLAVLTLNLTRSGLGLNREYVVVDEDPRDVAAAEALFSSDVTGVDAGVIASGRVVASPASTRGALAAAVGRAARAVTVEMEELSDPGLVDALVAARRRGCAVSVALPGSGRSAATSAAARRLAEGGVAVRLVDAPTIHAKAVVADDWLYVGSANLTTASLDFNREVGLALTDPVALRQVSLTIAADLARGRAP
jgi:phosphatidylserine/phosphatidylglycerophosphate/cardiolipin synthase-like enzyme